VSSKRRRQRRVAEQAAPDVPTPTYRVSSYTIYPTGYDKVDRPGKERWTVSVEDAGNGWAIRRDGKCLSIALQWESERPPELCDSHFLRRCRYNEHAAVLRARRVVDRLEVLGLTFDEFAAQLVDRGADAVEQARQRIPSGALDER
jgi:hypothetical protein